MFLRPESRRRHLGAAAAAPAVPAPAERRLGGGRSRGGDACGRASRGHPKPR